MIQAPAQQIPGVYHRRIGDIVVSAISDGYLDGSMEVLRGISVEEGTKMLADVFRPARRTSVNTFAIFSAGRVAVIDAGSGTYMGPTAGWQIRNLRAAGIDPAAIDTVLLTHMHPDHSAGLADRETGARFFPNAELVAHENEPRHWLDDAAMARATEREKLLYFQCAREQIAPYRDRTRLITGGEVFPGVTAVPAPGHTPGHTMYLIQSGGESLLVWGDITHVPDIQIPRPEVTIAFDTDPAGAIASRRRVLDMAATEKFLVAGMHLHFPAFSRIARRGDGYALVSESWVHQF
ncbi:MAG: MBL fold metallo-hydrolase [Proteobacteria bacterium]|nr:MBL fold metallo-hydrolase [Pseudomonadota bacterium]